MPYFKISRQSSVSTLFLINISDYLVCCSWGIFDIFSMHVAYTRAFTISQFLGCHTDLFFCEGLFHAARRIFFGRTLIIFLYLSLKKLVISSVCSFSVLTMSPFPLSTISLFFGFFFFNRRTASKHLVTSVCLDSISSNSL